MLYGKEHIKVENILLADSLFFDAFGFGVLQGNPKIELGHPGKVFLTESLAKKIMKDGQLKTIRLNNKLDLEIVGIIADPPASSHITYSMVASMPSLGQFIDLPIDNWGMTMSGYSYLALPENMNPDQLKERFAAFVAKYHAPSPTETREYSLQPMSDIHFNENYEDGSAKPAMARNNLIVLALLGGFILLVACVNFINLSTALAVKKSREIGVRKTLGANRAQLTRQFMAEAFLLTTIATLFAGMAVELVIQPLRSFLEKEISFQLLGDPLMIPFLFGLVLLTTLLSGAYPAVVLSSLSPAIVLKRKFFSNESSRSSARQYLVMFQFLIAQVLIVGTLVLADQMDYFRSKPLGFKKDAVINIALPRAKQEQREALHTQLSLIPGVEAISFSLGAPTSENDFTTHFNLVKKGNKDRYKVHLKLGDQEYLNVYGLELSAGRWFSVTEGRLADQALPKEKELFHYVVNEALVRQLGMSNPEEILGKRISTGLNDIEAEVIGVVKDFHVSSLHHAIQPTVLVPFPYFYYDTGIRFTSGTIKPETIERVQAAFLKVFPEYLFEYTFLDEHLASLYRQEERAFALSRVLTGLSIFISCLGLLGLISFIAQQKVKEVGIRKVFGATFADIVMIFSRSFVGVILKSALVAIPLSWYLMSTWLDSFAYRTPIHLPIFFIAIGATIAVAIATVAFQSIRSASANPVESLRSE
jgi:ABC-type antimicrobial peptide transport system permease subunit